MCVCWERRAGGCRELGPDLQPGGKGGRRGGCWKAPGGVFGKKGRAAAEKPCLESQQDILVAWGEAACSERGAKAGVGLIWWWREERGGGSGGSACCCRGLAFRLFPHGTKCPKTPSATCPWHLVCAERGLPAAVASY